MKQVLAAALAAAALAPGAYAGEIGVSVEISQPGVFGRIDIGRLPQPAVVLPQPVIIEPPPPTVYVQPQPIYMWVPPEHRRNWRAHCREYNACGVPVYFVRHDWYDQHVRDAPAYRGDDDEQSDGHGRGRGHRRHGHEERD